MSIDINKHEVDIDTLFKQNENDLCSIKELYRKLKEIEKKISQIKYINSNLADKLKKDYEKLKRIILDENIQAKLTNDINEIDTSINNINNDINVINSQLEHKVNKNINYVNVLDFGAKGDGVTDDAHAINNAINYANENRVMEVFLPYSSTGIYLTTEPIVLPVGMKIKANGYLQNRTYIKYIGDNWAIKTGNAFSGHRRNIIEGVSIDIASSNAQGGILIGDDSDDSIIPVQHTINNLTITGIQKNQIGIWLKNASGIEFNQVILNRGTGGTACLISANGNNTGVMTFNNSTFGGHNQNDVGIELRHGKGGLDCFSFNGCYFGGKKPFIVSGTSPVKNISLNASHFEATTCVDEQFYAIDIASVVGLTINSVTFFGKSSENFCAIIFRNLAMNTIVQGVDCNEFSEGILYKSECNSNNFCNNLLFQGTPTGVNRTIIQTYGDFSNCMIVSSDTLEANKIQANKSVKSSDLISGARVQATNQILLGPSNKKIFTSNEAPTTGITRGDFILNTVPFETGIEGSKYVVIGWSGVGTNNCVECRCLTGN